MNSTIQQIRDEFREEYRLSEYTLELVERSLTAGADLDAELELIAPAKADRGKQLYLRQRGEAAEPSPHRVRTALPRSARPTA